MSSFMGDKAFQKYFQKKLTSAKKASTNAVGTDYNRSQQAMSAVMGRMNQSSMQQASRPGSPDSIGAKLQAAQRNRNREQSKAQMSKPTENAQAKVNSLGSKLYGG